MKIPEFIWWHIGRTTKVSFQGNFLNLFLTLRSQMKRTVSIWFESQYNQKSDSIRCNGSSNIESLHKEALHIHTYIQITKIFSGFLNNFTVKQRYSNSFKLDVDTQYLLFSGLSVTNNVRVGYHASLGFFEIKINVFHIFNIT